MLVNEVFRSIQGESTFAGLPCTFIRLTGCNLRCKWCDTVYAYDEGREMSIDEILTRISRFPLDLVQITGGEPMMQKETPTLCRALLTSGATVLLETNGSYDISTLPSGIIRIMDIKCPASGEEQSADWDNIGRLAPTDEVKFVIANRDDFEWALRVVHDYALLNRCSVLFAPVFGTMEAQKLAEWILETNLPIRLQLQLHKYIWPPDRRGV